MKVCTISCHNALNHGARLQALALLHYLNKQGHTAEAIDYRPGYLSFAGKLLYWPGLSLKEWVKLFVRFRQRRDAIMRDKAFAFFSERYLPRTKRVYHTLAELQAEPPRADVYIAGSDQIWNTSFRNGTDAAFYLNFGAPETKRISYAASFAISSLKTECIPFVKKQLERFDEISVRETSGLHILASLSCNGRHVADPVFLLSAEEWDTLLDCRDHTEPYVLVYDVMGCDTMKRVAKSLAKRYGCKIYAISARRLGYAHKNFPQAAPDRFVELIRNARCVISNSFHGTAFASIYHKVFFVVDRTDGLNERMHDLLEQFGLRDRLITAETFDGIWDAPISYDLVDEQMQQHIAASEAFLAQALHR